jgi:hypothetical protein
MPLSIHYSAILKSASDLSELIREATEIVSDLNWKSRIVFSSNVSGLVISAPNCEPFSLCFNPSGETCNLEALKSAGGSNESYSTIHVETGYAGAEIHKAVIDILAYINRKYFRQIQVRDEGEYWQTRDYEILLSHFRKYRK